MEVARRFAGSHQGQNVSSPRRLAEYGYVARIATECFYVLSDPAQGCQLVQQTEIGALRGRMGEEAERSEAVVERDQHDAVAREGGTIIVRLGTGAGVVATPVDPHHYRHCLLGTLCWGPDV